MKDFIDSAESRETSREIMEAILLVCPEDPELCWDSPNHMQESEVVRIAKEKAGEGVALFWGAEGQVA